MLFLNFHAKVQQFIDMIKLSTLYFHFYIAHLAVSIKKRIFAQEKSIPKTS